MRLELAADYLVMAAWLAYLKSRLLLPDHTAKNEPEAAELAADPSAIGLARPLQLSSIEMARQGLPAGWSEIGWRASAARYW